MRKSRFMQEISGDLGEYWRKDAERKVQDYMLQADERAIVEPNGAIRWKWNGNYLMDDYCEVLEYGGYDFSREATAAARDEQNSKFLEEYRRNPPKLTEEDLAEMRSAFGEGTTVRDVITDDLITL